MRGRSERFWSFPRKFFRCQLLRLRVRETRFRARKIIARDERDLRAMFLLHSRNACAARVSRMLDTSLLVFLVRAAQRRLNISGASV
jgi:hypothetical protein